MSSASNSSVAERGRRLRNSTILVSAAAPSSGPIGAGRIQAEPAEIELAVRNLARMVFAESGTIVFGVPPTAPALIELTVDEWSAPTAPRIVVYQSLAFGEQPHGVLLSRIGPKNLKWVDAVGAERLQPADEEAVVEYAKSVSAMWARMVRETKPDAMILLGGGDDVEAGFQLYLEFRPGGPVYSLEGTGGAALSLARDHPSEVRAIDTEVVRALAPFRTQRNDQLSEPASRGDLRVTPYPLIMQTIVDELASEGHIGHSRHQSR